MLTLFFTAYHNPGSLRLLSHLQLVAVSDLLVSDRIVRVSSAKVSYGKLPE